MDAFFWILLKKVRIFSCPDVTRFSQSIYRVVERRGGNQVIRSSGGGDQEIRLSGSPALSIADCCPKRYYYGMVATKQQALEIASKVRSELEKLYGQRLRGVYLYGSAARDQLTPDSDIDIAIVLNELKSRFEEYEFTSQLGSDVSLEYDTLVSFLFVSENDYKNGRFAIHRTIKDEGIAA